MAYSAEEIEIKFQEILHYISEEGLALRSILKYSEMPSSKTFFKWLNDDEEKVKQYACACEARADLIFEDILEIADESHSDKKVLEDGREVVDGEVVQRSRLRIDARKWVLSKMQPKKYGDKIETTIQGGDKPIEISFED